MISVCMSVYNGERYLSEQLDSILQQLGEDDEIIISDDGSTDASLAIISAYQDSRIKCYHNPKKGVISSFENAINKATQPIIFLCDQDDIWYPNKVEITLDYFGKNPDKDIILSDLTIIDNQQRVLFDSFHEQRDSKEGFWKNVKRNSYIGCAMAFRSSIKKEVLPFPKKIPMHDMWIGLIGEYHQTSLRIPEKLVYYRRHDNNVSELRTTTSFIKKMTWRVNLLRELFKRLILKKS
ncbi:alpha-L-Rha alpha-1,3-L-rhamnosyltransferase [Vagococcus lutrae]|uniref:glycosyltransferase family 2 protein n=1 Tax=Vagococcus lutrae TaxID=81947 RepID=UPI001927EAD9|nr:glycosyltransferase family 2 protein [Vagococcus lutrae]GEQ62475.1 alpha-L-Rha alpha-1,3-L-rhamnosyltransferase [Vagococcus lutrae]GEQ64368.1 alpha-L-Rha alpha-1,3-L-rhamnosyltransferase [Vagococcus lutrae]GEQ66261.1 alpha-L-Rha alpha-1,3-L-rhamnosyltransferase [Vagococcus lutrae]